MNNNQYHMGDPCIHCGIAHVEVPSGPCEKNVGVMGIMREIYYLKSRLSSHLLDAKRAENHLNTEIRSREILIAQQEAGLDLAQISLAETVVFATDYAKGGDDRASARADAIKYFVSGAPLSPNGYGNLRWEFFGTKSYDCWHGQRTDCEYGFGPSHGSIIFLIGMVEAVRKRELTAEECEAAVYYLTNLRRIQDAKVSRD